MKGLMGLVAAAVLMLSSVVVSAQSLEIGDAKLGKGVQDREIVDETTTFAVNEKAYLWLRVTGGPGDIKVTWSIGDHSDSVSLHIGGSPWRTWANKTLWQAGEWKATVTDGNDQVLKEITFQVE
jgi:Protein of unknown function (DUF2914)